MQNEHFDTAKDKVELQLKATTLTVSQLQLKLSTLNFRSYTHEPHKNCYSSPNREKEMMLYQNSGFSRDSRPRKHNLEAKEEYTEQPHYKIFGS